VVKLKIKKMSSLNSLYIKKETLQKLLASCETETKKGIELTISISDEPNQYNQNVTAFISQSKEERDSKAEKTYCGNGRTFWTDGNIFKIENVASPQNLENDIISNEPF